MSFRFIHTADWQIGRAFGSFGGDAAVVLKRQRIQTVRKIAQLAEEHSVDAVLVAGDAFDSNLVGDETLHGVLRAMEVFSGQWIFIPGNHDPFLADSVWQRFEKISPNNVKLALDGAPIEIAESNAFVLTSSLRRKEEAQDLTEGWNHVSTPPGVIRVGLAHGSVEGRLPAVTDATNPIAEDRDLQARLDYVALGDWHGTYEISPRTFYSGTPEPDRFKQNDSGNVLLVEINESGSTPDVRSIHVAECRWSTLDILINQIIDLEAIEAMFKELGEPFERQVVSATVQGTVDLTAREALERLLTKWRARFLLLQTEESKLIASPTESEIDQIDPSGGFVRATLDRLRSLESDASDPRHRYARGALQLLYRVHAEGDTK